MTLPKKADKGYLKVTPADGGFAVVAEKEHAAELGPLFEQRGIPCLRQEGVRPGVDALLFGAEVDAALVREVLEGYKAAKGS
jgi:hypothetical protein